MYNNKRKTGKYDLSWQSHKNYIIYKILQLLCKITFIYQLWRWQGNRTVLIL